VTQSSRKAALLALLRQFSRADRRREFSFSSGVVGAVPMNDARALDYAEGGAPFALLALLALESAQFILAALLPVRNCALVARAILRRALNRPPGPLHAKSVISLGGGGGGADPYFGAFLASAHEPYNYLKIVGGFSLRERGWSFAETSLSYRTLLGLALQGLLHPLLALGRLAAGAGQIEGWNAKLLFLMLGFKETRGGIAFQNRLIAAALAAHVANDAVRTVIFPMEGRSWEKRLLARVNARGARSTGYLHCALTPRHAGLLNPGFFEADELPTVLRTPGAMAVQAIAPNLTSVQVRSSYFIRGDRPEAGASPGGEALLFALTGNVEESKKILRAIAGLKLGGDARPVVRLNPNAASYGRLLRYTRRLGLDTWHEAHAAPRLCFFRSSSVAIGYLRMNVVPVYLDLEDAISNNSFDVDGTRRFERVTVGNGFALEVAALADKYRSAFLSDGPELADYYLDQSYRSKTLAGLNELS
jgi:hypothetical protein